jgi:oxalate decarboxylase/phosphoglucose isomerase-like protein (cupin superfamily)
LQYAEICEVLVGVAHFLFQLPKEPPPGVAAVFYIEAHAGEKVLFPPGLDHCTINPADTPLLFSDVVTRGVRGDYSYFKAHQGAAYWEVEGPSFIPNPSYGDVPPIEMRSVHCYPHLSLTKEQPLYRTFVETRGKGWEFLVDPSLFWSTFPDLIKPFSAG